MFFTNLEEKDRCKLFIDRLILLDKTQQMGLSQIQEALRKKDINVSSLITSKMLRQDIESNKITFEDEAYFLKLLNEYSQHAREINSTFFLYWETVFRLILAAIGLSLILVGALDIIPILGISALIIFIGVGYLVGGQVLVTIANAVFNNDYQYQDKLIFSLSNEEVPLPVDLQPKALAEFYNLL